MIDGRQTGEAPPDLWRHAPVLAAGPGERPDDDEPFEPDLEPEPEPDEGDSDDGWESPSPAEAPSVEIGFTIDLDGNVDDERGSGRDVP